MRRHDAPYCLTISDRASRCDYADHAGRAIEEWLAHAIASPWDPVRRVIPDSVESVRAALVHMADEERLDLVRTSGGTGPAPRDLTPESMRMTLIVNLRGKPSAIGTCLAAVFPAVPYALDLIGAGRIDTDQAVVRVFRPS